ncbi:MAG: hydrolase [Tatlockia sp.]|nr:hydrolase [Tatlockia sp.]
MDETTKDLLQTLTARQSGMVKDLHYYCEINSGTDNIPGLSLMRQALRASYEAIADTIEEIEFPAINTISMTGECSLKKSANALFIKKRPQLKRRILLTGHMDTVYGAAHPFQSLSYINDNQINGPGVADMKGGLIVMKEALACFEQLTVAMDIGWDVLINADEEIGSPASSVFLDKIAADYQAALIYEPAMTATGTIAKNRRGSGKLTLIATGKSAHVGRAFSEGRNAICYLAEALLAIHALNQLENGITINVGKIAGGDALNMVPDKAVAKLDVRISKPEDELWVKNQLAKIIDKMQDQDYSLTVHGAFNRPIKRVCPATVRLFKRIQHAGRELGLALDWQDSGGCCDGNNLAQSGLPVIDTLGVRGGNIHSENEFILIDSLVERTALTTLLLCDLASGGLEELRL